MGFRMRVFLGVYAVRLNLFQMHVLMMGRTKRGEIFQRVRTALAQRDPVRWNGKSAVYKFFMSRDM